MSEARAIRPAVGTIGKSKVHAIRMGLSWAHLIEGVSGLVLVDAGSRGHEGQVIRRMNSIGRDDLRLIFITHAHLDHYGSAAALRRLTRAPIAVHEADAEAMSRGDTRLGDVRGWGRVVKAVLPYIGRFVEPEPTPADIVMEGGESLVDYGVSARVIHTPGHTPGSCSLLVDDRLLFVGDLISTAFVAHPQRFYATDWAQLGRSLCGLRGLHAELVYSAHGHRPIGRRALEKIIRRFAATEKPEIRDR